MSATQHTCSIAIQVLPHGQDIPLPVYETEEAAGMDLRAAVPTEQPLTVGPGERLMVPTGIAIGLPKGFEAQVRPRSGLAAKSGITVLNSPGTIDADYRGEIRVILINHGSESFEITRGLRIAQLVIAPVTKSIWSQTEKLPDSMRGSGGFGSTGKD